MITITCVGTVFQPLQRTQTQAGKTINKFVIRVAHNKDAYFIEVLVGDMSVKYAESLQKDALVYVMGEPSISAYASKTGEPKAKISLYAKSLKALVKQQEKEEFLW